MADSGTLTKTSAVGALEIIVKDWGGNKCLFKRIKNKDGAEVESLILDCLIVLLAADEDSGEYLMQLEGGDRSKGAGRILRVVKAKDISNTGAFREMVRPYSYLGGQTELEYLMMFWRGMGIKHQLKHLKSHIGRYKDELVNFWVLADRVQWGKGEVGQSMQEINMPDELIAVGEAGQWQNSIRDYRIMFPTGGGRAVDFVVGQNWYYIDNKEDHLDMELMTWPAGEERAAEEVETAELIERWGRLYGNTYMAYILLGWFCGVMYMQEAMEERGSKKFPLFALSGLTQSGKTSLIGLFMRFWGVQARPSDYTQVSVFADLKQLQMAHNFPIWRDEYRNVGRAQEKEPMLRSLYDRSAVYRGTATQELKSYGTSGTFLLSGEGVTIDPAIRRRFVYFEMQDRFKLNSRDWTLAEDWANDYAPELFYRAIEGGFNRQAFRAILESDVQIDSVNDMKEEKVCIAALGAVFGKELGEMVLEMGRKFWSVEKLSFDSIDRMSSSISEKFFTFVDSMFTVSGAYTAREFMGATVPPAALNFFMVGKENLYIKLVPLIHLAYDKGFGKMTTLDQWAVKSAVKSLQKGADRSVTMGGTYARVVAIKLDDIDENMALSIIADNVGSILGKIRRDGRAIGDDEAGTVEEISYEEDVGDTKDAFLLLQQPDLPMVQTRRRSKKRPRKI